MTLAESYTTTGLLDSTRRRAFLPSGTGLLSASILQTLTEEMRSYITSFLKGIREEYLVVTLDIATTQGVAIKVPERAVGAAFRNIKWLRSTDGRTYQLSRIEPERVSEYALTASEPRGYVFEGNTLILVPAVTAAGTIRVSYQLRPGQLVLPDACGIVTSVDFNFNEITIAARPATFTNNVLYDLVSGTPNFTALAMDQTASFVGSTVTITPLPPAIKIGDFLCLAGETCIAPLPTEVHDLLAQAAAFKIAQSSGSSRAPMIEAGLVSLRKDMTMILSPRSDGSYRPIISKSGLGRRRI